MEWICNLQLSLGPVHPNGSDDYNRHILTMQYNEVSYVRAKQTEHTEKFKKLLP